MDNELNQPKMPRILLLILASDDKTEDGVYRIMEALWRLYMNSHPQIDAYFYKANPALSTEYKLKDQTLYVKMEESLDKCYEKMLQTFAYFEPQFGNYDFMYRTNLSSMLVLNKLYETSMSWPRTNFCSAFIGTEDNGCQFPSGAGFALSIDVVKRFLVEKPPHIVQDDVSVGRALKAWGLQILAAPRIDFLHENQLYYFYKIIDLNHNVYHFRLKNIEGKRNYDIEIYKKLLKEYYHISL